MTGIFRDACKLFYGFRMNLPCKMIYFRSLDFLLNSSYHTCGDCSYEDYFSWTLKVF